jgi:hypothetical protein
MAAAGVRIARAYFSWAATEAKPGRFDFRFYDEYVEQLARYRIRVLPMLYGTPPFYSSAPRSRYPERVQPRRNREFARFARLLALRYGPGGSFWHAHRDVRSLPIRSWQVWNEPSISFFWAPQPDARQYVRMLAAVSNAIKRVDRRAEIVAAGLSDSQFGIPAARYLEGVYRAGGARWFDTVALHVYARSVGGSVRAVETARRLMNRHGDRRAKIWVTEFGWATGGPRHRFRVSPRVQAAKIRATLKILWHRRLRLRLRGAIYVMWRDPPRYRSDYWGLHLGLYRRDGEPKPAAGVYRRTARALH